MQTLFVVPYIAFVVILLLAASFTLGWMLYAWRGPQAHKGLGFKPSTRGGIPLSFSLIVPARHEQSVLASTLDRLTGIQYEDFEILCVVGDDDLETQEIVRVAAASSRRIRLVVDEGPPRSKPKSLNAALAHCRGDVVGVFDAEDDVHPNLLGAVSDHFRSTRSDVVQGGVQLMDYQTHWYSVHNVLEYFFWFRSRLHFHADYGFVPLGGNTVFIRRSLIESEGGWDEGCLAEDCELGIRLSAKQARISVCYQPELVTREETPPSLGALVRQRTRWNQGFLQVLRKRHWTRLPGAEQRFLAAVTLALPFFQALVGTFIPISIAMILVVKVPVWLALLSFLPLVPTLGTVAIQVAGLHDFGRIYGPPPRARDYAFLTLTAVAYQVVLAYGAARAVWREVSGESGWEATPHTGSHRPHETKILLDLTDEAVSRQADDRARSRQHV